MLLFINLKKKCKVALKFIITGILWTPWPLLKTSTNVPTIIYWYSQEVSLEYSLDFLSTKVTVDSTT